MWQHVFVCLSEDFHLTYGPSCHPCLGSGSTPCMCRLKIPIEVLAFHPLLDCLRRGVGNMPSENSCSKNLPHKSPFCHQTGVEGTRVPPLSTPPPHPAALSRSLNLVCFPQQLEAEPKLKSDPRPASHAELQFPLLCSCFCAVSWLGGKLQTKGRQILLSHSLFLQLPSEEVSW